MNTKEEDLCRALSMTSDMPHLMKRAIEGYENNDLKLDGVRAILNAKLFIDEYDKLYRQFEGTIEELGEMHGLDPLEVPYED